MMPVVLRAYVACGLVLWDHTSDVQLVKIHIGSRKLTFLEYEGFDSAPIPLLRRRVKVSLARLSCEVFEYGSPEFPKSPLLWKSRYLHEDYGNYAEQVAFDEELLRAGMSPSEVFPSSAELSRWLSQRRLEIVGYSLVPSSRVPGLDEACGATFSFRDFIECGETQLRAGVHNVPTQVETFNALHQLATKVLDPVIEYFGGIRLTYGVCCAELRRLISRRIAPELDQHAAHELNSRGRRICARDGAACDFIVDDEDMWEVAQWIELNLPFDRMYFYGSDKPIHVSYGPSHTRMLVKMVPNRRGQLSPRIARPNERQ